MRLLGLEVSSTSRNNCEQQVVSLLIGRKDRIWGQDDRWVFARGLGDIGGVGSQ